MKRFAAKTYDGHTLVVDQFTGDTLSARDEGGSRLLAFRVADLLNAADEASRVRATETARAA